MGFRVWGFRLSGLGVLGLGSLARRMEGMPARGIFCGGGEFGGGVGRVEAGGGGSRCSLKNTKA